MASTLESALTEAGNPSTSPKRLRELSLRKRKNERNQLRAVIAANPNAEEDLLLELAADHPKEVIGNPRFQLLQLSGEAWWENCNLNSLCSLALATGKDTASCLRASIKSRFEEVRDYYSEYVSIVRRESWRYGRNVEVLASHSNGHAPLDIDLVVELEVTLEGRNDMACLEMHEDASCFSRDWLLLLLQSLKNQDVESLFEVFAPWENEALDIVVEDQVEELISISTANTEIDIKGNSVFLKATGKKLFDIHVFYVNDKESLPGFSNGELQVPIFEHIASDYAGLTRGSTDDLGDLEPLWGWEPVVLAPEITESTWEEWLSAWIMS